VVPGFRLPTPQDTSPDPNSTGIIYLQALLQSLICDCDAFGEFNIDSNLFSPLTI
jgi:hypothetical protein